MRVNLAAATALLLLVALALVLGLDVGFFDGH
jgi:hypothetical protein